jgi:hypothetical protein
VATLNDNGKNDGGRGGPIRSRYGLGARGNGGYGGNTASAGNGGLAGASADGGIVVIDEINSGGNEGNTINVGDICAGPPPPVYTPEKPAKPEKPGKPAPAPAPKPGKVIRTPSAAPGKVKVTKVPSTGVGQVPSAPAPFSAMPNAILPARRRERDEHGGEEKTS